MAQVLRIPLGTVPQESAQTSTDLRNAALRGSPEDRANFVQRVTVPIPQYRQGLDILQSLLDDTGNLDDPGGAWIFGNSGEGKSVICRDLVARNQSEEFARELMMPVLLTRMEQKTTAHALLVRLLNTLGYPFTSAKNAFVLAEILANALRQRGVKLVLFDEAQEAGEGMGTGRPREIANVLKIVKDGSGVAFAFVGVERGLRRFAELGDQLTTRITVEHTLRPLNYDATFIGILRSFDQGLPTLTLSGLDNPSIAKPIHTASKGNFRRLRKLLSYSVLTSARQDAQSISREHLHQAYYRVFGTGPNPFDPLQ